MKIPTALCLICLITAGLNAQQTTNSDSFFVRLNRLEIQTSDFRNSRESLFRLVAQSGARIESLQEDKIPSNSQIHGAR